MKRNLSPLQGVSMYLTIPVMFGTANYAGICSKKTSMLVIITMPLHLEESRVLILCNRLQTVASE